MRINSISLFGRVDMENNEYFTTTVYPILIRESFNFALSAKLTGKVVG